MALRAVSSAFLVAAMTLIFSAVAQDSLPIVKVIALTYLPSAALSKDPVAASLKCKSKKAQKKRKKKAEIAEIPRSTIGSAVNTTGNLVAQAHPPELQPLPQPQEDVACPASPGDTVASSTAASIAESIAGTIGGIVGVPAGGALRKLETTGPDRVLPRAASGAASTSGNSNAGPPGSTAALGANPEPKRQALCVGGCVYIAADESVEILDPETGNSKGSIAPTLAFGAGLRSVAVNAEETIVAAGSNRNHDGTLPGVPLDNGSVFFIDPSTAQVTGRVGFPDPALPISMVFWGGGGTLLVLNARNLTATPEPARLYVIDVATRKITLTVDLPEPGRGVDLALTPDQAILFISAVVRDARGANHTTLFPFDLSTATFNGVIRLPGIFPGPIAMNPGGTRIYAPEGRRAVMVVDTATYEISEIPGVVIDPADFWSAAVSSNGRYLVVNDDAGKITFVDLDAGAVIGSVELDTPVSGPIAVVR